MLANLTAPAIDFTLKIDIFSHLILLSIEDALAISLDNYFDSNYLVIFSDA
jgi:hypothetical protein